MSPHPMLGIARPFTASDKGERRCRNGAQERDVHTIEPEPGGLPLHHSGWPSQRSSGIAIIVRGKGRA
jgi:hypothetical protein